MIPPKRAISIVPCRVAYREKKTLPDPNHKVFYQQKRHRTNELKSKRKNINLLPFRVIS